MHTALEHYVDVDQYIAANRDFTAHIETCWVTQCHAECHQSTRLTLLIMAFQFGELAAVIGALHFHRVQGLLGGNHQAIGNGHGDDVGQVVLTLGVLVR
ncbi:hypothetical protein D3C81_2078130 [compost metagenome]